MTFEIRSTDGRVYEVHTEVGDGLTRVVITEQVQPETPMESGDEE